MKLVQLVKKFPSFHEMQGFITLFTHLSVLSQLNPVFTLISVLILYFQVGLDLPVSFTPSSFPIEILYAFLMSPMRAIYPINLSRLDLIPLIMSSDE